MMIVSEMNESSLRLPSHCHDGAHQCIHLPNGAEHVPWLDEAECVGCNLCALVCPVEGCVTMVEKRRAPQPDPWNERVAQGRDQVRGGLDDLAQASLPVGL